MMIPRTLFSPVYGPMLGASVPARFGAAIESASVSPGICFAHSEDGYVGEGSPVEQITRERVDLLDIPVPHFDPKHRDTALELRRIVRGVTWENRDESQRQFWRMLAEKCFPGRALSSSKGRALSSSKGRALSPSKGRALSPSKGRALSPSKGRAPASIKALEIGFGLHRQAIGNMLEAGFEVTGTEMSHNLPVIRPAFFTNPLIRRILDSMRPASPDDLPVNERNAMRAGRLHFFEAAKFEMEHENGRNKFDIVLLNMPKPSGAIEILGLAGKAIADGGIVVIISDVYFEYFKAFLSEHNLWESVLVDRQNYPPMFHTDNPSPAALIGVFRAPG